MKPTNTPIILVPANPMEPSPTNSQTLLVNGGVTILAIFALTYFSKTLIDSISKLVEVWQKK
ncbi:MULTISPECIES: hypothetical protein [unclassified Coleofasciculus]|uniref:hypothetical protein n=1 Tax=unclassified Coleofasciculus TaxID=2692782 RepID=UPI0018830EF0|nr:MULTISPECIES: hypothetical protein [unclassified Coleofasciculus]MBE9129740.1 hypothetical protein [Coleofasciculus sp. LEGE 07081]MBE9151156.1 hypothetical protein [Coleofasciculus sp. LEGE 07092]